MSFAVSAESYDRFMGRYSVQLSPQMADFAGVTKGQRALDVGCGTGALTHELVLRLGPERVSAIDPSAPFVEAIQTRFPNVDVKQASADDLPFTDNSFDASLAQLVVHFMPDPVRGLQEMRRVTRPGGLVAACVWDHSGRHSPVAPFWDAARSLDLRVGGESELPGARAGSLGEIFAAAGLVDIEETELAVSVSHPSFQDWWEPFTLGVGPAGHYFQTLSPDQRQDLRAVAESLVGPPPFVIPSWAWAARGVA